eukprot:125981-Chlamydomonas_euryale.AAC.1
MRMLCRGGDSTPAATAAASSCCSQKRAAPDAFANSGTSPCASPSGDAPSTASSFTTAAAEPGPPFAVAAADAAAAACASTRVTPLAASIARIAARRVSPDSRTCTPSAASLDSRSASERAAVASIWGQDGAVAVKGMEGGRRRGEGGQQSQRGCRLRSSAQAHSGVCTQTWACHAHNLGPATKHGPAMHTNTSLPGIAYVELPVCRRGDSDQADAASARWVHTRCPHLWYVRHVEDHEARRALGARVHDDLVARCVAAAGVRLQRRTQARQLLLRRAAARALVGVVTANASLTLVDQRARDALNLRCDREAAAKEEEA